MSTSPRLSEGAGFIGLRLGETSVDVVPAEGARVSSLRFGGREWLGGGWLEWVPDARRQRDPSDLFAETGLLTQTSLAADEEGQRVTSTWRGSDKPWELTRTILIRADGAVEASYEAVTTGTDRLPLLWSAPLRFPLTARTRIGIPDGGKLRVASVTGAVHASAARPGDLTTAVAWPRLSLDQKPRDLSDPWSVPRRTLLNAWLELGGLRASLQLKQGDESLTLTFDGAGVPYCGLVIDRRRPAVTLQPSLGAPDNYTDACGDWQSITWLTPGQPRRWSMTLRSGAGK